MIYYRRYVKAFIGDTQAISMLEQGAYDRLLDHYYETETPIPFKREALIARAMSAPERKAVQAVLDRYFTKGRDGWHNKRADHEIAMANKARANGAKNGPDTPPDDGPDRGPEYIPDAQPESTPDVGPQPPTGTGHPFNQKKPLSLSTSQPPNQDQHLAKRSRASPEGSDGGISTPSWNAYSAAYESRYGVKPTRNVKQSALLCQLVKRIGATDAPLVAAWYVGHNRNPYPTKKHPLNLLVLDCEGLRTEWITGRKTSATEGQQADRTMATGNSFQGLLEEAEERERSAAA